MSQIASFTYFKEADVAFLGFWSKPKYRFFRKPVSKFNEYVYQHRLREVVFDITDGVYVALVFAALEINDPNFSTELDPAAGTIATNLGGSHWIVKFSDLEFLAFPNPVLQEHNWPSFLQRIEVEKGDYSWMAFLSASKFVLDRISDLKAGEAVLISVG